MKDREASSIKHTLRLNERISAAEVRLIDAKGAQLGLVSLEDAMERAQRDGLDLVEVAPNSAPPVCKIMDYRRHVFDQKRRLKEARKKSRSQLKEIRMRPLIDKHDLETKVKRMRDFLEKGHKVKITMRYRPREMRHFENGTKVMDRVAELVEDIAEIEANSRKRETARTQAMVLSRRKSSKT